MQASLAHLEVRMRNTTAVYAHMTANTHADCIIAAEGLQNQLAAAACVRSPHEYIQWLQVYVRRLCRENATARLRDVLDDLRGPLGKSTEGAEWNPSVAVLWRCLSCCYRCATMLIGGGSLRSPKVRNTGYAEAPAAAAGAGRLTYASIPCAQVVCPRASV